MIRIKLLKTSFSSLEKQVERKSRIYIEENGNRGLYFLTKRGIELLLYVKM